MPRCCHSHVDEWSVQHGDHRRRGQTDDLLEAAELNNLLLHNLPTRQRLPVKILDNTGQVPANCLTLKRDSKSCEELETYCKCTVSQSRVCLTCSQYKTKLHTERKCPSAWEQEVKQCTCLIPQPFYVYGLLCSFIICYVSCYRFF